MKPLAILLATASLLVADGGAVLLHQELAPWIVTVFASPAPPHAGMVDFSVLLQTAETLEPVLDADVQFHLSNGTTQVDLSASRDQARNKLLYAATALLDSSGNWHYTVTAQAHAKSARPVTVTGVLAVGDKEPKPEAYWPYLALPFVCLVFLGTHQWLRFHHPNANRT